VTAISSKTSDLPYGRFGHILRMATAEEKNLLPQRATDEWAALEKCRQKIDEHQLPMNVLDAEYQFDREKLSFFFEADGLVLSQ
jgi:cell fate regulator YaaT (PSP1 superfamily)